MSTIKNLTPHPLHMYAAEGDEIIATYPVDGPMVRLDTASVPDGELDGAPIVRTEYGQPTDLPEPQDGVVYVVAVMIIQALRAQGAERPDLVAPDTGPGGAVRDSEGRIIGVRRWTR